nr:MAG TPA: hypothetical protein [Caudoviricetes sp.]
MAVRFESDEKPADDLFMLSDMLEALSVPFSGTQEPCLTVEATAGYARLLSLCGDFARQLAEKMEQ